MWSFKSAGCSVLLAVDAFKFVCGCFVGGGVDAEVSVLVLCGGCFHVGVKVACEKELEMKDFSSIFFW